MDGVGCSNLIFLKSMAEKQGITKRYELLDVALPNLMRDKFPYDSVCKVIFDGKFPEITSWIRAVKEDFRLVKEMGIRETGILTSASDYHIFLKLKKTRKQIMDEYLGVVKAALDASVTPRCHLEDATRADVYGFCIPFN